MACNGVLAFTAILPPSASAAPTPQTAPSQSGGIYPWHRSLTVAALSAFGMAASAASPHFSTACPPARRSASRWRAPWRSGIAAAFRSAGSGPPRRAAPASDAWLRAHFRHLLGRRVQRVRRHLPGNLARPDMLAETTPGRGLATLAWLALVGRGSSSVHFGHRGTPEVRGRRPEIRGQRSAVPYRRGPESSDL
jgi:hypothetical protein